MNIFLYYEEIDFDFDAYEKRCRQLDEAGHKMLFGDSDEDDSINTDGEQKDNDEDDDVNDKTKDVIRRHQFDHNRNTCMTNNYPEMMTDENGQTKMVASLLLLQREIVLQIYCRRKIGTSKAGQHFYQMGKLDSILKER